LNSQRGSESAVDALSLEEAERVLIEKALARHGGDVRLTAKQLGLSRSALYRRLQQYGIRQ
jgi:DNA-binding NtrC family response regulator